ncbi:unnamed protein product [Ixodes hexagonus]
MQCEAATFVRDVYLDSTETSLRIHQWTEGDVGCVVWDGALVLGKCIDRRNSRGEWNPRQTVVELGAGTGAVGLICAHFGQVAVLNDVVLTDLPEFLPLIDKNTSANKELLKGKVEARALTWGSDVQDFKTPDVLLMSECVYYEKSVDPLVKTMTELCGLKTEVLLSYEDRESDANVAALEKFLKACGASFLVAEVPEEEHHPEFTSDDIHILRLLPKNQ